MRSEWKVSKLSEIAIINPKENLSKGAISKKVPMDRLKPFHRDIAGFICEEYKGGTKFRNNDTVMARITPCLENGKIAKVAGLNDGEIGFGSTEYIVFRSIQGVSDADFLYYLLCSPLVRIPTIKSMVGSSGRQRVQTDVVANLEIKVPPIKKQRRIGSVLKALDDKIELNNAINNNLEQQAQAIFDNMFGKRKPNGKLANIILENPKSKIKVCDVNGVGGRYPFFTSGQAILKYMSPLTNGRNCYLNTGGNADVKFFIGEASYSTDTWCICGKDQTSDYLYLLLKCMGSELNDVYFEGSALKHLQKQSLKDRDIYIPSADELKQFNALVIPMFDLISKNNTDNSLLAETRDLLLPKLMSGELDVSGVDL